jgi:hypothetical protein
MDREKELNSLKAKLQLRVPNAEGVGCVLCRHILADLEKFGALTNKIPEPSFDGKPHFPVEGKAQHLYLEGFWTNELKSLIQEKK